MTSSPSRSARARHSSSCSRARSRSGSEIGPNAPPDGNGEGLYSVDTTMPRPSPRGPCAALRPGTNVGSVASCFSASTRSRCNFTRSVWARVNSMTRSRSSSESPSSTPPPAPLPPLLPPGARPPDAIRFTESPSLRNLSWTRRRPVYRLSTSNSSRGPRRATASSVCSAPFPLGSVICKPAFSAQSRSNESNRDNTLVSTSRPFLRAWHVSFLMLRSPSTIK
mmetsp:Transcript_28139/g.90921  ORF Transcript_28139/g.90921 Transcript_28139/m.90921 type:complete len:223 (-) Transcript_28139:462-1130(-)